MAIAGNKTQLRRLEFGTWRQQGLKKVEMRSCAKIEELSSVCFELVVYDSCKREGKKT